MRSKEEIEAKLTDLESELDYLKEWTDKALKSYQEDKRMWGKEADDGEYRYARDNYDDVKRHHKILKWVLANESENSTTNTD